MIHIKSEKEIELMRQSAEIMKKVDHLWFGDGQPEEPIYRLEPVFHFLKTGKKWQGSSMYLWKDAEAIKYFKNDFLPALEKALPGASSPDYVWTREKLQILKDIYCLTYLAVNDRPMVYTMYLSRHPLPCNGLANPVTPIKQA